MKRLDILTLVIFAAASVAACELSPVSSAVGVQATQTLEALATTVAAAEAELVSPPVEMTPEPATEEPSAPEPAASATPSPTIAHLTSPSNPGAVSSFMTDRSSQAFAAERRSIGDNYNSSQYERPFTSQVMDYQPHVDLVRAELSAVSPWFYVTFFVEEAPPATSMAYYGVELDLDLDGRGDWYIAGMVPTGAEWTTNGVKALRDENGDVGGPVPLRADAPQPGLDGYEALVFDAGLGPDPDAAWIRRSPTGEEIQLAFKMELIGFDDSFLWGAWSDEGRTQPGWMDFNDHFTLDEAGSPVSELAQYPLQALASIDNTCRWGYNYTPTGSEPGVCAVPPTPTPEPQGSISGYVYRGGSSTYSGDGMSGVTVRLGSGGCTSTGLATTTTNSSGAYTFTGLPAGTYCVSINSSTLPPASYNWEPQHPYFGAVQSPSFNPYQGVTLGPDEARDNVNFAFMEIVG
jgi:hypothetical protein